MALELRDFAPSRHLDSDENIRAYLEDMLETGNAKLISSGLGDVARAKGMAEIAAKAGLSRESLYRALSEDGNPRLDTLMKVLAALGVKLAIAPQSAAE